MDFLVSFMVHLRGQHLGALSQTPKLSPNVRDTLGKKIGRKELSALWIFRVWVSILQENLCEAFKEQRQNLVCLSYFLKFLIVY